MGQRAVRPERERGAMAAERLSMRQIREILRQKWTLGRSHREVAEQLGAGLGTISGVERRARAAGLDWPQVEALSDEALEARLYGRPTPPTHHRPVPDCAALHAERRKPGVTLELLHLEYLEQHPDGYRYTQFCELYRQMNAKRAGRSNSPQLRAFYTLHITSWSRSSRPDSRMCRLASWLHTPCR